MAKLALKQGTTSKSLYVFIQDSSVTTGAGLTGLAYNTSSLVAYYVQPGGSATAITLATQTATGAWSSGGFVAVDGTNMPGLYRLDVPNAALTGATAVVIMLKGAANMAPCVLEIELTAVDNQDATRFGLSALPNAAAEASGGLVTRGTGTGQITVASGAVTVGTNNDKTGYTASTVSDKTGYTLSSAGIDAILDRTDGVETGWTLRQTLRVMSSALAGILSGAATTTVTIRNITNSKARITATVDADGNRSAVTLDGS